MAGLTVGLGERLVALWLVRGHEKAHKAKR